jgi:spore coat protein U-like protein
MKRLITALALLAPGCLHAAAGCSVSAPGIAFGAYDVLSGASLDSSTDITFTCTRNPPPGNETVTYSILLSVGGGTYAARTMSNGGATINYNLYTTAARSPASIWGNGAGGTITVGGSIGPLTNRNPVQSASHTIYGRVDAGQDVPAGAYSASVVITVNW